jgi:hypothetical protein
MINNEGENIRKKHKTVKLATLSKIGLPFCPPKKVRPIGI